MTTYNLELVVTGKDQASRALGGVGSALQQMGKIAVVAAVAAGTVKLARLATDAAFTAARVQEMNAVLGILAEKNDLSAVTTEKVVEAIKARGIETQVAQQTTAQFIRYEIDLAKATDFARVAQDAAVLSMENSSEALDGLLYGVLTFNPRILRTHGINVNLAKSFDDLAASMGKSAEELTEQERISAALNAVLQEGQRISGAYEAAMGQAGKQWRSLARYGNEVKVIMGEGFVPVLGAAAVGLTRMGKVVVDNKDAFVAMTKSVADAAAGLTEFATGVGAQVLQTMALAQTTTDLIEAIEAWRKEEESGSETDRKRKEEIEARMRADQELTRAQYATLAEGERMRAASPAMEGAMRGLARAAQREAEAKREVVGVDEYGYTIVIPNARAANDMLMRGVIQLATSVEMATVETRDLQRVQVEAVDSAGYLVDAYWDVAHSVGLSAEAKQRAMRIDIREAIYARTAADLRRKISETEAGIAERTAELAKDSARGMIDTARQVTEFLADQEQTRARNAEDSLKKTAWSFIDANQWIDDNAAEMTEEMAVQFRARNEAAKKAADETAQYDVRLAAEIMAAEEWYQEEALRVSKITDEKERAAAAGILEREMADRTGRAREVSEMERRWAEEDKAARIAEMREAGAAAGDAMADELLISLKKNNADYNREWEAIQKSQRILAREQLWDVIPKDAQTSYDGIVRTWSKADEIFDPAIEGAEELLKLLDEIRGKVPGIPAASPGLPAERYEHGGVVPGYGPRWAVLEGGEVVLPPPRPGASRSAGPGMTNYYYDDHSVINNYDAGAAQMVMAMHQAARTSRLNAGMGG